MNLSSLILTIETIFDINLYQPEIYFLSEIPIDIIWTEVLGFVLLRLYSLCYLHLFLLITLQRLILLNY
ncbi:MAG: hypothetical protein Ct9H300mP6_05850 [Gammaproteobacteria bacterium]|nr:MAG: hypothetical protein Ct9H300mP6_05850 [Gammaproteobacteria bacterium]